MVICAIGATLLLTHLPCVRTPLAVTATTLFMICMSGRFVPAMARCEFQQFHPFHPAGH